MAMDHKYHPVWTVYDKLRTARLNVKYFGRRLHSVESRNFWIEGSLAVTAPSSAVAGLWFWSTDYGRPIWQTMGVLAAILAAAKPLLSYTKRIKDYESILSGYRSLEYDLMEIKTLVEQKGKYDATMQAELRKAVQREKLLVGKNPESREDKKTKKVCEEEVLRELPSESFFVPEDGQSE